jgi:hypothetical protein
VTQESIKPVPLLPLFSFRHHHGVFICLFFFSPACDAFPPVISNNNEKKITQNAILLLDFLRIKTILSFPEL